MCFFKKLLKSVQFHFFVNFEDFTVYSNTFFFFKLEFVVTTIPIADSLCDLLS